jgi:hypothetical protein
MSSLQIKWLINIKKLHNRQQINIKKSNIPKTECKKSLIITTNYQHLHTINQINKK